MPERTDRQLSSETENQGPDSFEISRDRGGRIRWTLPGNSPLQNLDNSKKIIRTLVISQFPEITDKFLRDENGMVLPEIRRSAEDYIYDKSRSVEELKRAIVNSRYGHNKSFPAEYRRMATSLEFALAAAFESWGLFDERLQSFLGRAQSLKDLRSRLNQDVPASLILVDADGQEHVEVALAQKAGIELAQKILLGQVSFESLPPICLTDIRLKENRQFHKTYGQLYVGPQQPAVNISPEVLSEYQERGVAVMIPKSMEKFGYYWVDIHPVDLDNKVDLSRVLQSIRVNLQTQRLEVAGWRGSELQAFFDYALGKIAVEDPNALPPFVLNIGKNGNIHLGLLNRREVKINLDSPPQTSTGEAQIYPRYDHSRGYFWVDGYDPADAKQARLLFTRRVVVDSDQNISLVDWKGLEIQSFVDWAYGRMSVSKLEPFQYTFNVGINFRQISLRFPNLLIKIDSKKLDPMRPVTVIPREDGGYKWIEVVQQDSFNPENQILLTRALIDQRSVEPKVKGRWHGIERQLLVDFWDDRVGCDQVRDLEVELDSQQVAYVVNYHGKAVSIPLRSGGFSKGDRILLRASIDPDNFIFQISKAGRPLEILAESRFDKESSTFKTRALETARAHKVSGYWTDEKMKELALHIYKECGDLTERLVRERDPKLASAIASRFPGGWPGLKIEIGLVQVNRDGIFTDKEGIQWGSSGLIAQEVGIDFSTLIKLFKESNLDTLDGWAMNSQRTQLYRLDEAVAYIQKWRESNPRIQAPLTPEEADDRLMTFFEEVDE